jgi:putative PIN family toxin of toxin-antitoxin system
MIRVVFDTSVLYSAVFKQTGLPAAVFDLVVDGLVIPCVSPAVLAEDREVLLERPALRPHRRRALKVLGSLADVAIRVTPNQTLKISDHEEDNRFYECADAAGADYIVTSNTRHFKESYKTTQIVNARQLLELLAGTHRKE